MKKIMCAVAWLCAAFVLFAQTTDESITDSVYQKLLQYRVAHDSNYRQLQMQADIAANKAEKAKTESLVTAIQSLSLILMRTNEVLQLNRMLLLHYLPIITQG